MDTTTEKSPTYLTEKELFDAVGLLLQVHLTLEEVALFTVDPVAGTEPDEAEEPESQGEIPDSEEMIDPHQNILDALSSLIVPVTQDKALAERLRRYVYNHYAIELPSTFPRFEEQETTSGPTRKVIPFPKNPPEESP